MLTQSNYATAGDVNISKHKEKACTPEVSEARMEWQLHVLAGPLLAEA